MTVDHRLAAQTQVAELISLVKTAGNSSATAIVAECEALERAIGAFHMEGIRFRMFNVDRLVRAAAARGPDGRPTVPETTLRVLEDVRKHLEAAGFHTRSHQAPK